jgi:isopenicillin N synthase-like dioxygenase
MSTPIIPTINLTRDTHQQQAAAIRHALSTVGFFIVEGSGIDTGMIKRVFEDVSSADICGLTWRLDHHS